MKPAVETSTRNGIWKKWTLAQPCSLPANLRADAHAQYDISRLRVPSATVVARDWCSPPPTALRDYRLVVRPNVQYSS